MELVFNRAINMINNTIKVLTKQNFDAFLETPQIVAVYFWAEWCEPCHAFQKSFEKIVGEYPQVRFGSIDVEAQPELMQDFGIRSVPTIAIFREHVALCI